MISVLALALIVAAADAKYQRLVSPCETRRWHIDIENVDKPGEKSIGVLVKLRLAVGNAPIA